MSRHLIVLQSRAERERAARYIEQAPSGTRVELKAAKRTLPQNDRMWAMLTDISTQKTHGALKRKYTPDTWKCLFLHALGREATLVPSLDGSAIVPIGQSSSDLSKDEMSQLIELMLAWGAENGVQFHDGQEQDGAAA